MEVIQMNYRAPELSFIGQISNVVLGTEINARYDSPFQLCEDWHSDPETATDLCEWIDTEW
jgi:hypothetical protein